MKFPCVMQCVAGSLLSSLLRVHPHSMPCPAPNSPTLFWMSVTNFGRLRCSEVLLLCPQALSKGQWSLLSSSLSEWRQDLMVPFNTLIPRWHLHHSGYSVKSWWISSIYITQYFASDWNISGNRKNIHGLFLRCKDIYIRGRLVTDQPSWFLLIWIILGFFSLFISYFIQLLHDIILHIVTNCRNAIWGKLWSDRALFTLLIDGKRLPQVVNCLWSSCLPPSEGHVFAWLLFIILGVLNWWRLLMSKSCWKACTRN